MKLVVLSLGSNIDRENNIARAVEKIGCLFGDVDLSPVYETGSVGFEGPSFFNLVAGIRTDQPLLAVRDAMREIEAEAGRIRGRKSFDNRVLDIDVLLFGDQVLRPEYNIPRDEIDKYAFVLKPLADLYPDLTHPLTGRRFADMWQDFDAGDQALEVVEFPLG